MAPPLPLSEIPTLTLLYKLRYLSASSTTPTHAANNTYNNVISLIRHDITALRVSAIVNAANRSLLGGGGVDGAIHARAGPGLVEECEELGGCETGSAKITSAHELPCDKVIHAVGPVYWSENKKGERRAAELLKGCYRTSLKLAVENKCKSLAFSCISTGVYGYPSREAASEALGVVRSWLEENEKEGFGGLERIVFCCFERKDEKAYEELIPEFFPPLDPIAEHSKDDDDEALAQSMPDPPATEPTEEGQPDAKKQKLDENADEEWETLEKPEGSATNGLDEHQLEKQKENISALADSDIIDGEKKEDIATGLHTAEMGGGGNPPIHGLQKDW